VIIAATINQPDKPKKYVNIRSEELQIYPKEEEYGGCARIKSPAARIIKDMSVKSKIQVLEGKKPMQALQTQAVYF